MDENEWSLKTRYMLSKNQLFTFYHGLLRVELLQIYLLIAVLFSLSIHLL